MVYVTQFFLYTIELPITDFAFNYFSSPLPIRDCEYTTYIYTSLQALISRPLGIPLRAVTSDSCVRTIRFVIYLLSDTALAVAFVRGPSKNGFRKN
jgi:hypothetical protein